MGICGSKNQAEPVEHPSLQHKSTTNPAAANQQQAQARAASRNPSKERLSKQGNSNPGSREASAVGTDEKNDEEQQSATTEVSSLLTIPFFQALGTRNLKDLRSIFTRKTYDKDDIVISEGQKESCFHVIIIGSVRMTAKNNQGENVEVMELKNGDWFGEIFLMEDHIQPVTVIALEPTTILYINSHEFNTAIKKFPELSVSVDVIGRHPPISIQLKKVPFFADVSELKLHLLGTLCDVRRAVPGQVICAQGADADGMYFIIQGRVEVSASGPEGKVYLDTLTNGDWFGEIALLEQTRRTATVTCTQDCMLLYLSRQKFDRFLRVAPEVIESGVFESIIRKRTANSLKAIPIFAVLRTKHVGPMQQFDERRLALLGQLFRFINIDPGTVICSEGEPGENFFIIVRGICTVTAKAPDQQDVFLAELSANEWFGETALMMSSQHQQKNNGDKTIYRCNATVTAKTLCVLLKLSGENFQQFLHIAPEVEEVFKTRVSVRTAERLRKIPFFSAVRENKPWSKLDLLGGLFQFEEYPTDTIIFREGSIGEKFYVIVAGQVEVCVQRAGSFYLLDTLQPDDWFGEIALMKNTPRTATITTKGDCVLLSITADKFKKFLTIAPELAEPFNALLNHRTANMLKTLDLFKQLHENKPWSKLEMLGALFNYEQHKPNKIVYRIGDPGDKFYLIVSGRVRVEDAHGHTYILSSQQHFGELAVLRKTTREATVTTLDENNIFLYLHQGAFDQFISVAPELKSYFDNLVIQRQKLSMDFANNKEKKEREVPIDLVSIRIDEATPTTSPRTDQYPQSEHNLKALNKRSHSNSESTSAVNFNFHAEDDPFDSSNDMEQEPPFSPPPGSSSPHTGRYRIIN